MLSFISPLTVCLFLSLWIGSLHVLCTPSALALTIIRKHVPPGDTFEFDGLHVTAGPAPRTVIGEGNLVRIFQAAADSWEQAIKDTHTVTIQFGWSPLPVGGGIHSIRSQSGFPHRVTEAIVYFDNNGSTLWFLDPTPLEHSEFPTLVECSTPTKNGQVNSGRVLSGKIGADNAIDLLSIAKHEIGHALGLSTWNIQWVSKNVAQGLRLTPPRPFWEFIVPIDAQGHVRLAGALMEGSLLPGQRKLASVIDILAIAEMGEFSDLKLDPEQHGTPRPLKGIAQAETRCLPQSSKLNHHR